MNECIKLILIYNINLDIHKIPSLRVAIPSFPGDLSHHQTQTNTLTVHLHPKIYVRHATPQATTQ